MKIRELLTDESKWTKGANRRDKNGQSLPSNQKNMATCWCLFGALLDCYYYDTIEYWTVNQKIINKIDSDIAEWNDAPERTFEDVKKLVEELDI